MEKNLKKVKAGWMIPESARDSFTDFCVRKGTLAQEDCAGALVVWQHLPAQLREWAKAVTKGEKPARPEFWSIILPKAINDCIRPEALSDEVLDRMNADSSADRAALADIANKKKVVKKHKPSKHDTGA